MADTEKPFAPGHLAMVTKCQQPAFVCGRLALGGCWGEKLRERTDVIPYEKTWISKRVSQAGRSSEGEEAATAGRHDRQQCQGLLLLLLLPDKVTRSLSAR